MANPTDPTNGDPRNGEEPEPEVDRFHVLMDRVRDELGHDTFLELEELIGERMCDAQDRVKPSEVAQRWERSVEARLEAIETRMRAAGAALNAPLPRR